MQTTHPRHAALPTHEQHDGREHPPLADLQRRLVGSAVLTIPLVVVAMTGRGSRWLELVLATPVVLWGALPFFDRAIASLRTRRPDMWTLIGLGTATAYAYSVVVTVAPGLLPSGDVYF